MGSNPTLSARFMASLRGEVKPTIVDVNLANIEQYPPRCFLNPKNEGYRRKLDWLKKRFVEGLRIKLLYDEESRKDRGFIEYVRGENAWRAVEANSYLFIHCLWVSPNEYKEKGYGSRLIEECVRDAKGKLGVAVVSSDGPFMASKEIFLRNGFTIVEENGKDQLLVKRLKQGPLPRFKDYEGRLKKHRGWHIVYSDQCPWVARFIAELPSTVAADLKLEVTRLTTPKEAQNGPSVYSVFNLIHDGKILADRYISSRRFHNILKKELGRSSTADL